MSNYQRLISYIYTYEGGIKGKNIGFAKLETRGAQCRITVNVKKIFVGGNPIGVYLLSEKKEWRIGTLFARNGAGEFRAAVNSADVESSGLGIEEFYGLSVHDVESTWRSYTTIWEDAVSHAAEVELADVTAENARKKQTPEALEQEIKKQNTLPISHEIEQALEQEALNTVREDEGHAMESAAPGAGAQERDPAVTKAGDQETSNTAPEVGGLEMISSGPALNDRRMISAALINGGREKADLAMNLTGGTIQPVRTAENERSESAENEPKAVIRDLKNRHRDWSAAAVRNLRESLLRDQAAISADSAAGYAAEPAAAQPMPMPRAIPLNSVPERPRNPQGPVPEPPRNPQSPVQESPRNLQSPVPEPPRNLQSPVQEPPRNPQSFVQEPPRNPQRSASEQPRNPQCPVPEQPRNSQAPVPEQPGNSQGPAQEPPKNLQAPGQGMRTEPQGPGSMGAAGRRPMNVPLSQNRMGGRMMPGRNAETAPVQNNGNPGAARVPQNQPTGTGEAPPTDFIPGVQGEIDSTTEADMWEQLRKKYPKILAFDYADGCEVLTIKPQDIGLLPRETWLFGNNSFLLHGYYNYRYLILARLNNSNGKPRYLLGVPGHYYNNEKYMAGMFGFPDFVLAKKQQSGDGRFGYWYTDVKMGD